MTSNNLQCEMDFHTKADSPTMENLTWFQRINLLYSMCKV